MAGHFLRNFVGRILFLLNIAAALMLLAGCFGNSFAKSSSWITGLLALMNFYMLLTLIVFLVIWLFIKPAWSLVSLISIIISWQPLKNIILIRKQSSFEMAKTENTLRLMTWNVEQFDILNHKKDPGGKQRMIEHIRDYNPDVACFQEMVAGDSANKAINFIQEFRRELNMPYFHYSYNPRLDFDKRHHFGIVIFSKYPLARKRTINEPPHNYNSIFQYADLVKGNDTFRIFNCHLQTLRFTKSHKAYLENPSLDDRSDLQNSKTVLSKLRYSIGLHHRQSDRIRREMDKSPHPVILCGDLNDVPNSYAYYRLGKDMKDVFREKGAGMGRTYTGISPTLRIDHIFCNEGFDVSQYTSPRKKMSDHFPVIADMVWQR